MSARTVAGLLATLGLAVMVGAALLARNEPTPAATNHLLPDLGGRIRLAVATASSARRSPLRSAALVTEIGRRLPVDVDLLLLTNDAAAFEIHADARSVRFVELPADVELTMWPQDPFVVVERAGRPMLLAARDFGRADDARMADALGEALGWPVEQAPFAFEGGNLVSDQSVVFVGADTLAKNVALLGLEPEAVASGLEALFGKRVVAIGPHPQPIAHIDLVLTPVGDRRVLLADPRRGADIADALLHEAPDRIEQFEAAVHDAFFGDPRIEQVSLSDGTTLEPPPMAGRTHEAITASRRLAPDFDALAESLEAAGFRVARVPLLVGPTPEGEPKHDDARRATGGGPTYPILSYNNVLLEERDGRARVYLPRYGLTALDDAGREAWERAGFEVVSIDGLATSAMYGGALRCALKVLARDTPGLDAHRSTDTEP